MLYTDTWQIPWWCRGSRVFLSVLLTTTAHWERNPFPRRALYDSVVSVEAPAFYALRTSRNHRTVEVGRDLWSSHHYTAFYRRWNWLHAAGLKGRQCVCCLPCIFVRSLMSALVLAWAYSKLCQHGDLAGRFCLQRSSGIGSVSCAETAQAGREQEDVAAGVRSSLLAVEPQLHCAYCIREWNSVC